jgi:WD40 repeat protein
VATCSGDRTVKIWNPNTNYTLIRTYTGHSSDVYGLEWIDQDTIASLSIDGTIQIWFISTGSIQRTINNFGYGLKMLSNGFFLAIGTGTGPICIYNINTGDLISTLTGHSLAVYDLILINNSTMASSGIDQTIRIWDLTTMTQKLILNGHTDRVIGLKLLSFEILGSSSYDTTIKIWNTTSGELIRTLSGHTGRIVWSLDLMGDGETLVSGSSDQTIKHWNWRQGQCLNTINTGLDIWSLATIKTTETDKTTGGFLFFLYII